MTIPKDGQTVHMMTALDVLRVLWSIKGRNAAELRLYTTDDLRHRYHEEIGDLIRLRDGIVSRVELVAVIRWRVWWARFGYGLLLLVSVLSACFALLAWRDPVAPPPSIPTAISAPAGK